LEPLNLIIVEDEEAHYQLMRLATLKEFPAARIHHFVDAQSCLDQIDEIGPDAIIADYRMPGMSGIEFLQVLSHRSKDIPVIIITGQGDERIAVQAIKLGAWDYLVKSSDSLVLLPSLLQKVVSERRLRTSLLEAERRFQDLAESTLTWLWETDRDDIYTYSNTVVEKVLGYAAEEVVGRHFCDFLIEEEREHIAQIMPQIMLTEKPVSCVVIRLVHRNGHEVIVEANGAPILDKAGNLMGHRGMNRDITKRRHAEEHIRLLTQQSLRAQESERLKLSRELHDTIGQELSALKIGIDTLLDDQPEELVRGVGYRVVKLSKMLQETIGEVRNLAYDLRPATLEQFGLVQTIHQYCDEFSGRNGIQVHVLCAGMDDLDLGFDTRITLFRLVQEGLNNVRKHAEARNVSLRLVASSPMIIFNLEDDGKGFDVENRMMSTLRERCMGICSMEERVALLGGTMKLDSRPMQGTRIRIEVPLREDVHGIKENHCGC
jgi:PAS domain S-box-containing protein